MELNLPVRGSYTSAEARATEFSDPPAIKTRPSFNRVAVARVRAWAIEPVGVNPDCRVGVGAAVRPVA
ncbi:MAG TPA: hypothetical protein VF337_01250, partial [Candidatus Limnocylindrales bacterium]